MSTKKPQVVAIYDDESVNISFLNKIGETFIIPTPIDIKKIEGGNINTTYKLVCEGNEDSSFILQKINKNVFKQPEDVMKNIKGVTRYIKQKILRRGGNPERETLYPEETLDGKSYLIDEFGDYWRIYNLIKGAKAPKIVENTEIFKKVGQAFGQFQEDLGDFPAEQLEDTIPDFHNTPKRFSDFGIALRADKVERYEKVKQDKDHSLTILVEYLKSKEEDCNYIAVGKKKGDFLLRVTHNDTKIDNVMIDEKTGEAICVIDLDTVMKDSVLVDYGDAIRSGTNKAGEKETDLEKIEMNIELFESFTRGFLEKAGGRLTKKEIEGLHKAPRVMAIELSLRFVTDYLNGDEYFELSKEDKKSNPDLNLQRALVQAKLARDMERKEEKMKEIVNKIAKEYNLLEDKQEEIEP